MLYLYIVWLAFFFFSDIHGEALLCTPVRTSPFKVHRPSESQCSIYPTVQAYFRKTTVVLARSVAVTSIALYPNRVVFPKCLKTFINIYKSYFLGFRYSHYIHVHIQDSKWNLEKTFFHQLNLMYFAIRPSGRHLTTVIMKHSEMSPLEACLHSQPMITKKWCVRESVCS